MPRSRVVATFGFALFLAGFAIANGCSGDDNVVQTTADDSGAGIDTTTSSSDATSSTDAATSPEASSDAAPPHVIFVTNASFTGDLVSAAIAMEADAGVDAAALEADAGDGGTSYLAAANALCQNAAEHADVAGTFVAVLGTIADAPMQSATDADGPWARIDGVPVADSIADLRAFHWKNPVNVTETKTAVPDTSGESNAWTISEPGFAGDCNGWTSSSASDRGGSGCTNGVGEFAGGGDYTKCLASFRLFCAQIGSGAGPNRTSPVPSGGKLVFIAQGNFGGGFALPDAGLVSNPPDAGDAVHSVADAICSQNADAAGLTGKFYAWISSSAVGPLDYFASLGMNGPWYRKDGIEIAATRSELSITGIRSTINVLANGTYVFDLTGLLTGDQGLGVGGDNCSNFTTVEATTSAGADEVFYGYPTLAGGEWSSLEAVYCNYPVPQDIACFEQ